MAYATEITIGTGSKMSANYQSQDFNVSLTYQIERDDADLMQLAEEKATEVEALHALVRCQILKLRTQPVTETMNVKKPVVTESANGSSPVPSDLKEPSTRIEATITKAQERAVKRLVEIVGLSNEDLQKLLACRFGWNELSKLTRRQGRMLITDLQRRMQRKQERNGAANNSMNA